METGKQDSKIEIKDCVVKLERLVQMDIDDDSSDLPPLFSTVRRKTRPKKASKSSAELLKEHQSLAQNLKGDKESFITIEETIRRLEIVEIEHTDDRSSVTPDPPPCEENDAKIFCVKKFLQFFNSRDVTPAQCGYENRCHDSFPVHIFEQKMLSFKRIQFEHVISSFLYAAKDCCISDCKSFITFLLKTISVHSDISCISACYRVLSSLLDSHPDSSSLTFSSAEIFMLLFNYGVDIDNFKFISKWTDMNKELEIPQYQNTNYSSIPDQWLFNLNYMLKSLIKIISICAFKETDLEKIITFFMWMSTDPFLLKENLWSSVRECIYVCLEHVKEEKWNETQCNITNYLMSLESATIHEKWATISEMMESIPRDFPGTRPIQLRKQISYSSLKRLLGSSQDLEESCLGFSIEELQSVILQLGEIDNELLKYASKFVDSCAKDLNASKEEYNTFCNVLKKCESSLSGKAQNEKTQFLKIYAKLRTFCGQKVSLHERSSVCNWVQVKSECDNGEFNNNYYSNSSYDSEINDKKEIPHLSEGSQNYSVDQPDHPNSSSNENSTDVYIKSEYMDEPCSSDTAGKASSIKILLRKKRSSRSSSGNGLADSSLPTSHLKCGDDNLSRPSSEFECHLLSDELSAGNALNIQSTEDDDLEVPAPDFVVAQDFSVEYPEDNALNIQSTEDDDLEVPGPDFVVAQDFSVEYPEDNALNIQSTEDDDLEVPGPDFVVAQDFSVEYPEDTSNSIKVEPEQYYDYRSMSPEVDKMDIVDNEDHKNEFPAPTDNYASENLFADDLSPLPEICEVKSIALSNMEAENSSVPVSGLLCEPINSTATVGMIEQQSSVYTETEHEIVAYKGGILNHFSQNQENIDNTLSKQATPSSKSCALKNNLLNIDEEIVIIEETISCKKLPETDQENIPSAIQRYSKALPEISITPVKNMPSSPVQCKNNLTNNEDIIIIKEKTPTKESDSDVIFLKKIASPSPSKSGLSPKTNIVALNEKQVNDKTPAKLSIALQVKVSQSCIESQGNNSDNDEIVIIDEKKLETTTSEKNESSKIIDSPIASSNDKAAVNISHVTSESPSHQCKEVLTSVLNQVEKKKIDFQHHALNTSCQNPRLKQADMKKDIVSSQTDELLSSIMKCVDLLKEKVSDPSDTDSYNEHFGSDDKNSHSTEKSTSDLRNETSDSMISLKENSNTVGNNLEIEQESQDKSNRNMISPCTISHNPAEFTNKVTRDNSDVSSSNCLNRVDISVELNQSSQSFSNDLQEINDGKISGIGNESKNDIKNCLKKMLTEISHVVFVSKKSVKLSATKKELISASDVPKKTFTLRADASQIISNSDSEKCNSDVIDTKVSENQNVHSNVKSYPAPTNVTLNNKAKDSTVPLDDSLHDSLLQNNKENSAVFDYCTKNFKMPLKGVSIYNENTAFKSSNSKIELDRLMKQNNAKKTLRNQKRTSEINNSVAKKSLKNNSEIQLEKIISAKTYLRRNASNYMSPSSRIKRKRSSSVSCESNEDIPRKSPRKYFPVKSPLSKKYSIHKSPKDFYDYNQMRRRNTSLKRTSLLSDAGLNLQNILRERIESPSTSSQQNNVSDDDDFDIIELYTDPKRFADKECLVVYETEDIIVLD